MTVELVACEYCGGLKNPKRKRCDCQRGEKNKNGKFWRAARRDGPAYESSLVAAHNYHLNKSRIKSAVEARARTHSRPGVNRSGPSFTHAHPFVVWRGDDNKAIAVFMYRTELAYTKNRDEFAGLMKTRVALRLQGMANEQVCEWLDLSRRELAELDGIIVGEGFLRRIPRSCFDGEIPTVERKMKKGVAADILRRRRMNYKQSQVLTPQQLDPFKR